jgi:hypothetical protein
VAIQKLFTSLHKTVSPGFIGEKNRIWYDPVTGFRVSDGVTPGGLPAAISATNANIGDLVITGATISTLNQNENLNLNSNGTGNVNIIGSVNITTTSGKTLVQSLQNGTVNLYVPNINSTDSAIDIIGSSDSSVVSPQTTGVMLHITGQNSPVTASRIYNDGANGYAAYIGRRYNGTSSAPSQVFADNLISRIGATPYTNTGWPSLSTTRIDFVSADNQTSSTLGSRIEFWTTPVGTSTVSNIAIIDSNGIYPGSNNIFQLGTPTARWNGLYIGPSTLHLQDTATLADVALSVTNGTLYLNGAQNLAVGNLVINNTTLTTLTPAIDINVGNVSDTGNLIIGRSVQIDTNNLSSRSAFAINGTGNPNIPLPNEFPNTLLHISAVPGYSSRMLSDAYGTGVYALYVGRQARGTIQSPTQSQAGDIFVRYGGSGYGTSGFNSASNPNGGAIIQMVATENWSDSSKGTNIQFLTTPTGSNAFSISTTITSTGILSNSIQFSTDNSIQTTAGIPLTQRAQANGVATLGIDGRLSASQIPSSLTGAIVFQGGWYPGNNTPTLSNGTGTTGQEYAILTTGTANLGSGSVTYSAGGYVIYGGGVWNYTPPATNFTSLTGTAHTLINGIAGSPQTGALTVTTDATSNNVAGTIVSRDNSGNFVANIITATLSGAATSAATAVTVTGATQTAITQVGTLSALAVSGNITAGNVTATGSTISATNGVFNNINNQFQTISANTGSIVNNVSAIQANIGGYHTWANANIGTLSVWLGNIQSNVYANANVAAFLSSTTININTTGNITTSNATVNNTLTANTVITGAGGIRTISGGTPTVTINFNTDQIVYVYQPTGTVTIQYGTLVAGSTVTVLINFANQRNIVTGVTSSNNINLSGKTQIGGGGNAPAATNNTSVKLVYTCIDGTAGNTHCSVNYS